MKAFTKISVPVFCIFILFSCSKRENPEARKLLNGFKNYVDTIVWKNNNWKNQKEADVTIQERPIDPNDPSKVTTDTFIMTPDKRKTILYPPHEYGYYEYSNYISQYKNYLKAIEPFLSEMNEGMKKEFEDSKNKFESLLPPKNILDIDKVVSPEEVMRYNNPPESLKKMPPEVQKQIQNNK